MTPEELSRLQEKLDVTQKRFAELLGVTEPALSLWLSGKRDVPDYIAKSAPLVVKDELAKRAKASA